MIRYGMLLTVMAEQVEEQVQFLQKLGTCFGVIAALFLLIGTALFFCLDIRTVIGEKTGRIAQMATKERKQSTKGRERPGSRRLRKRQKGKIRAEEVFGQVTTKNVEALTEVLPQRGGPVAEKFVIRKSIMLIHTDEYI